jgi:histidinol dehydrogenase
MKIGFYDWSKTDAATKARVLHRSASEMADVSEQVKPILADVKTRGDEALRHYAQKFDGATLSDLKVSAEEFEEAARTIDPALKQAIDRCAANVKKFHAEQMRRVDEPWMIEIEPGVFAGEKVTPVSSLGIYVPGGKNLYPSTVYMLCIPAVLAGVPKIAICTPPQKDGKIGAPILYAAQVSGVTDIYKAGGAVAIAAFAYGTESVPAMKKVVGPCSLYGATAKLLLSHLIDPGMPAGPSDSLTLCDHTADPYNTVLDIINEAEHGPDSAGVLVTHDRALADYVRDHLPDAINALPEPQRGWLAENMEAYGGIVLTNSLEESIAFANEYAPEHMLVKVADPDAVTKKLVNVGEILIGEDSVYTLGNYGVGVNHVLPTGGMAHSYSCTSVWDFLKRTSISRVTREGREALSDDVCAITDYEGFPGHANALRQRR